MGSGMADLGKRREWFRQFALLGYSIVRRRSGHYHVRDPGGRYVTTVAASPSDYRSNKNAAATVRRYHRQEKEQ